MMSIPDTALHETWCERRDADAFTELVCRHSSMVFSACMRVLGNEGAAEEVAQECFVELMKTSKPVTSSVAGWLHTVATRRSVDRLRSDISRNVRENRYAGQSAQASEPTWDDVSGYIDQAVAELSKDLRIPMVLRFLGGKSHKEIAQELDASVSTVKRRLDKGIASIRERLGEKGIVIGAAVLVGMLDAAPAFALPTALAAELGKLTLAGSWAVNTGASGTAALKTAGTIGGIVAMKNLATIAVVVVLAGLAFIWLDPSTGKEGVMDEPKEALPALNVSTNAEVARDSTPEPPDLPAPEVVGQIEPNADPAVAQTAIPDALGSIGGEVIDTNGNTMPTWLVIASVLFHNNPREKGRALTDESGQFHIANLEPGNYELWLQPGGNDKRRGILNDLSVTLREGENRQGLRLVWEGSWNITGRISDVRALPLAGIKVLARPADSAKTSLKYRSTRMADWQAMTGEDGSYDIQGLPPSDDYPIRLEVTPDDYMSQSRKDVRAGTEQDFIMRSKPTIAGRVVSAASGEPIPDFTVGAFSATFDYKDGSALLRGMDVHNERGIFSIRSETTGAMLISAHAPGHSLGLVELENVHEGEAVTNVVVRLEPSQDIEGIVVDASGNPVSEAMIFLGYPAQLKSRFAQTESLADGTFRLATDSPITNIVTAYRQDYAPAWVENTANNMRIVLTQGGTLEGTIMLDGVPVDKGAGTVMQLLPNEVPAMESQSQPDENGQYRLERLTPGPMKVDVTISGTDRWLRGTVYISDGSNTVADFDFPSVYDAALEGTVHIDGIPAEAARIRAWTLLPNGDQASFLSSLDGDGNYQIDMVPAGTLNLDFFWVRTQTGEFLTPEGVVVETRNGETARQDFDILTE